MASEDLARRAILRNMALSAALYEIAEFARAHHREQPSHELLHALTVDIPEMCEKAAGNRVRLMDTSTPTPPPAAGRKDPTDENS